MANEPAHLLIVDDSENNRNLLVQWLRREGYRLSTASNGLEALRLIGKDRPDLVLLDLMMPVMDGFGVLEHLGGDRGPFLPVIVVTAAQEREARLRALKEGANEFLLKPVDMEELSVRVRTLLALKEARMVAERRAEELTGLVAERTRELEAKNHELEQANEELREADRYKDEFLSVISHELRTPLNFIMGFASILEDEVAGDLNAKQHEFLRKILGGSDRMLALVNNLLDVSRMSAGQFSVAPEETALAPLIREVISSLQPLAIDHGLTLMEDVEVPPVVILDGARIVQVLTNLVDNAIKFTPPTGTITLWARAQGGFLRVEVRDTGPGISAEDRPKLFTRFKQLDMGHTRKVGGSGLGLSICKAIVEAHGGTIGVDSQPGKGSTFWFRIPLRTRAAEDPAA